MNNIKHYIKKPIPIEAIQYTGNNFLDLQNFAGEHIYKNDTGIYIHTLEGEMKMKNAVGDYLIKGVHGEYYFCEKSIFEETYKELQLNDRNYMCCQSLY